MRRPSKKIIVITAIIILALLLLTKLEFGAYKAKTVIYPILWLGFGVLGVKYYQALRGSASAIRKSIFGLGLALYLLGTLVFGFEYLMCAEINYGISYIDKQDKRISLECRTFGCYGTSDNCQLYKVRHLTKSIKLVTKFDEFPVDTSKWQYYRFP